MLCTGCVVLGSVVASPSGVGVMLGVAEACLGVSKSATKVLPNTDTAEPCVALVLTNAVKASSTAADALPVACGAFPCVAVALQVACGVTSDSDDVVPSADVAMPSARGASSSTGKALLGAC